MSPDPSVHEDQLREVEAQRAAAPRRRRGGCCACLAAVVLFLAALVVVGWILLSRGGWTLEEAQGVVRQEIDALRDMTQGNSPPPATDESGGSETDEAFLEGLRERVAAIQREWEEKADPEDVRRRLEALRADLAERRTEATAKARETWDVLSDRSASALRSLREAADAAPEELEEMMQIMEEAEPLLRRVSEDEATSATQSGREAENSYDTER